MFLIKVKNLYKTVKYIFFHPNDRSLLMMIGKESL